MPLPVLLPPLVPYCHRCCLAAITAALCCSSARVSYFQQTQVEEMCAKPEATALAYMQVGGLLLCRRASQLLVLRGSAALAGAQAWLHSGAASC